MNLAEFKKKAEVVDVNTTNGWGFNGYYGKIYTLGKYKYRQAKWKGRHTKPSNYDAYFIEGKFQVTKDEFLETIDNN